MSARGLDENVERFLRLHIHSVEQLEVLLLLRVQRAREWTAEEVARELRIDAISARARLEDLQGRGLLAEGGERFHYQPRTPELDRDVGGLAHAYAERRVTVINLIFSKPSEKISTFADAFKLFRKEGE